MLIVNADDWGRTRVATDTILSCFSRHRVTSASAMVFMEDSERAARLARFSGLEVGLHINLSERFSASDVPKRLRDCHDPVRRFLKAGKYAPVLYNPFLARKMRSTFDSQYAEFLRLYGRRPSHLDGHQHLHLASNILIQRVLPTGSKVRRSFSFRSGERSAVNRWYRQLVDCCLARRHRLTDYFFALSPNMSLERLRRIFTLAKDKNVELMTHPEIPGEYQVLMSEPFRQAIGQVRMAGYDSL
jgi:predicted glycoside hydrolase/deacetylase ChbG (UPF0249 family)